MKDVKRNAIISFSKRGWEVHEIAYQLSVSQNAVEEVIKEYKESDTNTNEQD
ncbi:hypothetical protein NC796_07520 [Aliifodinibius sp. S!AR15-10]|uniref:hypothetical protein n=1 Tax=Aliifodinibius sp. S!AR15-10 TaxID=2950437 RepID=UPI0028609CFE|nr:hypothetical protein [Aliifodinibius sp. S!AR15-10]MDR8390981.1 hypothetical protein [Aliifodinibius sp. S!AR15-10]